MALPIFGLAIAPDGSLWLYTDRSDRLRRYADRALTSVSTPAACYWIFDPRVHSASDMWFSGAAYGILESNCSSATRQQYQPDLSGVYWLSIGTDGSGYALNDQGQLLAFSPTKRTWEVVAHFDAALWPRTKLAVDQQGDVWLGSCDTCLNPHYRDRSIQALVSRLHR